MLVLAQPSASSLGVGELCALEQRSFTATLVSTPASTASASSPAAASNAASSTFFTVDARRVQGNLHVLTRQRVRRRRTRRVYRLVRPRERLSRLRHTILCAAFASDRPTVVVVCVDQVKLEQ